MKIISIVNRKGGVGKTTITFNLSYVLSQVLNKKILMVDFDSQANLTTLSNIKKIDTDIFNMLKTMSPSVHTVLPGLDILPATEELCLLPNYIINDKKMSLSPAKVLSKLLNKIENEYDYIFIDCPPSLDVFTVNAISASNGIIIPATTSNFAITAISSVEETISDINESFNINVQLLGVIINSTVNSFKTTKRSIEDINSKFKLLGNISQSEKVKQSEFENKPIMLFDPKSKINNEYLELAKNICKE